MKEIVFVTSNKGKIASAQKYFKDIELISYGYDFIEPRTDDIEEIAISKVRQAYAVVGKPCIALDAGFFIKELNGFPKAYVNFALETIGIDGILKLMNNIENRECCFKECLAYYDGNEVKCFYGMCKGNMALEKRGIDTDKKWSDLWYIFMPKGHNKTLAEMTEDEREERKKDPEYSNSIEEFAKWYIKHN